MDSVPSTFILRYLLSTCYMLVTVLGNQKWKNSLNLYIGLMKYAIQPFPLFTEEAGLLRTSKLPEVPQLGSERTQTPARGPRPGHTGSPQQLGARHFASLCAKLTWSRACNSFIFSRFGKPICVDRLLSFWRYLWIFITWTQRYRTNEKISTNSCHWQRSESQHAHTQVTGSAKEVGATAHRAHGELTTASLNLSSRASSRQTETVCCLV